MGIKSGIEWTDGTWNCITGCTKVSQGCSRCYAELLSERLQKRFPNGKYKNGFKITLHEKDLKLPRKWKEPRKIFVNSMSDMFHKDVPFRFIDRMWDIMLEEDRHTYQILTKRPERMLEYVNDYRKEMTPSHIWLGTSVENAKNTSRIDVLAKVKAEVRFISFEPLIGDVGAVELEGVRWAIVGGESGPNHRPIKKEWIVNIKEQCKAKEIAFFFKQWGGITAKSGGSLLDGEEHKEYPEVD